MGECTLLPPPVYQTYLRFTCIQTHTPLSQHQQPGYPLEEGFQVCIDLIHVLLEWLNHNNMGL